MRFEEGKEEKDGLFGCFVDDLPTCGQASASSRTGTGRLSRLWNTRTMKGSSAGGRAAAAAALRASQMLTGWEDAGMALSGSHETR